MSDPRKSSRPVICRPQSRSRLLNSADGCANCHATKKWWPTAADPTALLPIRPFVFSNRPDFMPDGSKMDCRSGKRQVFRWSPWGKGDLELATTLTAWLMPRISRAVPYLGYILVGGLKP